MLSLHTATVCGGIGDGTILGVAAGRIAGILLGGTAGTVPVIGEPVTGVAIGDTIITIGIRIGIITIIMVRGMQV